jgi:peptidoglycan/LPS O-acetylase OafA/YrhL
MNRNEVSDWYSQTDHFACLNGLRAISIVAVVWHHTAASDDRLLKLFAYGYHGVTLFFLISGFLITTLLLKERDRTGKVDLIAFFARRSLRIFPLYYAVLLAYFVLVFMQERNSEAGASFFNNVKYFASYTSNIFVALDGRVIFYFAWSLAAEEQFYLLLAPILAVFTTKRAFTLVSIVTVALISVTALGMGNSVALAKLAPLGIWLGTTTAFLLRAKASAYALEYVLGKQWSAPTLGIVALYLLETHTLGEAGFVGCLALMFIACLLSSNKYVDAVLGQKLILHIGKVSYGIYLLHMLCKAVIVKIFTALEIVPSLEIVFVTVLLATIVVATVSFETFEKFFLKFKAKFAR